MTALPARLALRLVGAALAFVPALALAQDHAPTIVIDTERIAAQARDVAREAERAAREVAREAQRGAREWEQALREQVHELHDNLKELELDFGTMAFVHREFGGRNEIVKNAPYSAEAVNESVQVLADGNRIVKQDRTLLARDRYGRTRHEKKAADGTSTVYIFDPIEGRSFVLNPERRTAMRIPRAGGTPIAPLPPLPPVPPVPPMPGVAPPAPPAPPAGPGSVAPKAVSRGESQPRRVVVRRGRDGDDDVRIEVVRIGDDEWPRSGMPHALTLPLLPRDKGETTSLGTRDFGGVKAEGTQTTHTIPAGRIGNEKPIAVTTERWFSPELHIVVFARTVDPRVGESNYRLVNLKREDPPAELFRVPADYRRGAR